MNGKVTVSETILWVDDWDYRSLWATLRIRFKKGYRLSEIRYFGKKARLAGWLGSLLLLQGCANKISKYAYALSHHDSSDGEALFWHIWREVLSFGKKVAETYKTYHYFLKILGSEIKPEALELLVQWEICNHEKRSLGMIRLVDWYIHKNTSELNTNHIVLIKGRIWETALKEYAGNYRVTIFTYMGKSYGVWILLRLGNLFYKYLKFLFRSMFPLKSVDSSREKPEPSIGVFYAQGMDVNQRSDLYWLPVSGIAPQNVVIYMINPPKIADEKLLETLKRSGCRWLNLCARRCRKIPNDPLSLRRYFQFQHRMLRESLVMGLKCLRVLPGKDFYIKCWLLELLLWLFDRRGLYQAILASQNIKVHFGLFPESNQNLIALHMAVERSGAVDVYVHWSNHPDAQIFPLHDVYFTWGPYYRPFYEQGGHGIRNLIYSGYPFDYAFTQLRDKALEYRRQLMTRGVRFVIAYFDNAYWEEGWFSKESLLKSYRVLLKEVASHPDWALVIKPKRAGTFQFIFEDDIPERIGQLQKEGRCLILDKGELPALAALASDIVIGFGTFSTPGVESALAGVPTLLYDPSVQLSHPFYKGGQGKFIFTDMTLLLKTVINFYRSPNSLRSCGYETSLLREIDPYQDGKASQRIGTYIRMLWEEITYGSDREGAIRKANERFQKEFGSDKVIPSFDKQKDFFEQPVSVSAPRKDDLYSHPFLSLEKIFRG